MRKNSLIKMVGCLIIVAMLMGLNLVPVFAAGDTWVTKASMPTARWALGAAAVNGKIYAIGGRTSSGVTGAVEEYNPTTNTWSTKANMPTARGHIGAEVVDGKIYVIGGWNGSNHLNT